MPSEAKKKANRKMDEANGQRSWRCTVIFPETEKELIVARAESRGQTVSEYIRSLIDADMLNSDLKPVRLEPEDIDLPDFGE